VYRLIEKPENWIQNTQAQSKSGRDCLARGKFAKSWCLLGAAWKVIPGSEGDVMTEMELALNEPCIAFFNDTHDHAEVLALLQSAIDRAPERP
jgi:hypothetical protein